MYSILFKNFYVKIQVSKIEPIILIELAFLPQTTTSYYYETLAVLLITENEELIATPMRTKL